MHNGTNGTNGTNGCLQATLAASAKEELQVRILMQKSRARLDALLASSA